MWEGLCTLVTNLRAPETVYFIPLAKAEVYLEETKDRSHAAHQEVSSWDSRVHYTQEHKALSVDADYGFAK